MNKIIDVSHFQTESSIDWDKSKLGGVDGVYIKSCQGNGFVDPMALLHANSAKEHSLPIGFYFFADTTNNASNEASFFNIQLSKLPKYDFMPVLDIEDNKGGLTGGQIETWIDTFINEIKVLGHDIMLYSYQPFLDQYLPKSHQLGRLPLWLAQYRDVSAPFPPIGWNKVSLWQYTNKAIINGISVPVDCSKVLAEDFVINKQPQLSV